MIKAKKKKAINHVAEYKRKMLKKDKHALDYNTKKFLGKLYVLSAKGLTKVEAKRVKSGHKRAGEKVRTTKEGRTYTVWYR